MKVLVACEHTGIVRDAFIAEGHDAWSCDLLPSTGCGPHLQKDILEVLRDRKKWDLMIAHPDCTYLCSSGLHWNKKRPGREAQTTAAVAFVRTLMAADIEHIAVETANDPVLGSAIDID